MKKLLVILLVSIFCLTTVGVARQVGSSNWAPSSSIEEPEEIKGITQIPEQFEGFGISLSTDKSIYSINEPIIIKLKVFNYGNEEVTFHFRSSQRYDFSIFKGEEEISRWSKNKFFLQVLGEIVLEPEEIIVYEKKFEAKLEAGSYKVIGELTAEDKPLAASLTITIKEDQVLKGLISTPIITMKGTVKAVDPAAGLITVEKKTKMAVEEITFKVDEKTRYENVKSLKEIVPGDTVVITYKKYEGAKPVNIGAIVIKNIYN